MSALEQFFKKKSLEFILSGFLSISPFTPNSTDLVVAENLTTGITAAQERSGRNVFERGIPYIVPQLSF